MAEAEILDSTEKIRNRLESEYQLIGEILMKETMKCLGYKTSQGRPENRNPSVCPQWEHFHPIIESRESLIYRISSLIWHCRQFNEYQQNCARKISELKINGKDHHNEMRDAYYTVSYLFDDVVFGAASVFDYLAQLIFRLNFPTKRGQKFWNDLVKERNHEDPELGVIVSKTNKDFANKLARLRGRSIHTQADIAGLELSEQFNGTGVLHTFNFTMPKEALKITSIFDSEKKDFPIEPGAYLLALQTIVSVRDIVIQLGSYKYECKYRPFSS